MMKCLMLDIFDWNKQFELCLDPERAKNIMMKLFLKMYLKSRILFNVWTKILFIQNNSKIVKEHGQAKQCNN